MRLPEPYLLNENCYLTMDFRTRRDIQSIGLSCGSIFFFTFPSTSSSVAAQRYQRQNRMCRRCRKGRASKDIMPERENVQIKEHVSKRESGLTKKKKKKHSTQSTCLPVNSNVQCCSSASIATVVNGLVNHHI